MPAYSAVAGTDLRLAGNSETNYLGLFYAGDQLELVGEPRIHGQLIASNNGDFRSARALESRAERPRAARRRSSGTLRQTKLLPDQPAKAIPDLGVPGHRHVASRRRVSVDVVAGTVSHQEASRLGEFTDELTPVQPLDLDQPSQDWSVGR